MKVVVLAGGRSSERDVSLASGTAVAAGLVEAGHEVSSVEIGADGAWRQARRFGEPADGQPIALTPGSGALGADVVFPVLHGPFGEDGTVQGLLESLDVPYVGAGVAASAICIDKLIFKDLMAHAGLPQVDYRAVEAAEWGAGEAARANKLTELTQLGLPVFVKPARLGSSVGISRVAAADELTPAIETAIAHDPRVIVEAAAPGAEIECSVIGNRELTVSALGRLEFDGDWYDYAAKYDAGGMRLTVPAQIAPGLADRVRELALRCYRLVGCAGLARVDFFVDQTTRDVFVNELNTLPGFTPTSVFAKLFAASGLPYPELLDRLVTLALDRHAGERAFTF